MFGLSAQSLAFRAVSSGALALSADGARLFVVNPDSASISVVDTAAKRVLRDVAVGREPRTLTMAPDGRYIYVTNEASGTITIVDAISLVKVSDIAVGLEPYGIVTDGRYVYVSCAATAAIAVVEPFASVPVVARIPVGPKPKGLALSADGARLYVTHFLTGDVTVIDTNSRSPIQVISTGVDSNMAQKIVIHPQNGRAYLPHLRSNVTNRALLFDTTIFPVVSAIDLAAGQPVASARLDLSVGDASVNLPFDAAFSSDGQRMYVANLGSGDVLAMDLTTRMRLGRIEVGDGPRGIVVNGATAYVANSLSHDLSVVDLDALRETARIPLAATHLDPQLARGKLLFVSSRTADLSRDRWMSCASCHFEGEHDGRTWNFTAGPRNTTSLRGLRDTSPLHWSGDRDEVQDFELTIRDLQAGTGLVRGRTPHPELATSNGGLSADLDALAAFVATLAHKPGPHDATAAAARGRAVFERADVGCATCHKAPLYVDASLSTPLRHDVGTGAGADERVGPLFNTPTLIGLWDSAPYLHDGSAPTLRDVVTTRNPNDRHGRTSHLTSADVNDLVSFLLSLGGETAAPASDDDAADPDGDGISNYSEHLRQTDPLLPNVWHLSEGATGFFEETIAVANPRADAAEFTVAFLRDGGTPDTRSYTLDAHRRLTITVNELPGLASTPLSAVVTTTRGGLVVERTMTWDRRQGTAYGGHMARALPDARTAWYLAEGEAGFFDTYILIANARAEPAAVTAAFLLDDGSVISRPYTVAANSRLTIYANDVPGLRNRSFATTVTSSRPITVERAMYFGTSASRLWNGGHVVTAIEAPSTTWFVAEGRTGPFFDEYLLLANPGSTPANVTVRYLKPGGDAVTQTVTLRATSRMTIHVDAIPGLEDTDVSASIAADAPIVVERAMYWPGPHTSWHEAHASSGVTRTGIEWAMAAGEVGGALGFETYVLIANPTDANATVTLTFLRASPSTGSGPGGAPVTLSRVVHANARLTVSAAEAALANEQFGVLVTSTNGVPIVVEHTVYWHGGGEFWGGGGNETAVRIR